MKEEKRKRILRVGCLISQRQVVGVLLDALVIGERQHRFQREGKGKHVQQDR